MTNEQLVIKIKFGIDTADNMLQLWKQCRLFIHSIAIRYQCKEELEDLEQEGYLALYDAVDGFKAEYGCKFLTYAEYWIKHRMQRYIQNSGMVRIPVHECEKTREYKKLVNAFYVRYGRKPTRHEIAHDLGISVNKVVSLEKSVCMGQIESIDSYLSNDEDSGTVADMISGDADVEAEVLESVRQEQLKAVIWSCVDALPEEQGHVLRKRFVDGMTLQAAGESIGVNTNRASTIENKALRNLEHSRYAKLLRPFLADDDIYSRGLVGNGVERFNTTWTSSTERAAMRL